MDIEFRTESTVEYVDHMGDDESIARAARVSTKGLDNQNGEVTGLVRALWRASHHSPFEHSHLTVAIETPMFVRDQIVRHKSMSFSVASGRYKDMEPVFWLPGENRPLVQVGKGLDYRREAGTDGQVWATESALRGAAIYAWGDYQALLDQGITNEVARAVLPASLFTSMWVTGSLRSWLHFLDQRLDKHAQYEIRDVAAQVEDIIKQHWPIAWEAWSR